MSTATLEPTATTRVIVACDSIAADSIAAAGFPCRATKGCTNPTRYEVWDETPGRTGPHFLGLRCADDLPEGAAIIPGTIAVL